VKRGEVGARRGWPPPSPGWRGDRVCGWVV